MVELKTGDVILVHTQWCWYKPVTYLSACIRFFDKTYYNHCKMVVTLGDRPFITEALASGICLENATDNLQGKKIIVLRLKQPLINEAAFIETALKHVGYSPYNFFALLQQFIYLTTGIWIKQKKQKWGKYFDCSQWDAFTLGLNEWWKFAPRDLLQSELLETIYKN